MLGCLGHRNCSLSLSLSNSLSKVSDFKPSCFDSGPLSVRERGRERDGLRGWFSVKGVLKLCPPAMIKCTKVVYVVLAFFAALLLGALKALLIGPIASLLLIVGNGIVLCGLFPAHVVWTILAVLKTSRFDAAFKVVIFLALPTIFSLWLLLGISGSVLVGIGYGVFSPWISTFEAFRRDGESRKCLHSILDGTWSTIKGSCTVVRDFADICYHSYPEYLMEMNQGNGSAETQTIRLMLVPSCIMVGLMGLIVEIPVFILISVVKSPYMLFKGWQRLVHDLVSREGPFLETACVPIAGLVILLWPLVVVGSILLTVFASIIIGLYGSVIVFQEKSFARGVAYIIAMVAEFDEYTNDYLYLREGSCLPKPQYRKNAQNYSSSFSMGSEGRTSGSLPSFRQQHNPSCSDAPGMLVPRLARTMSIKETIQEVKMVKIWEDMMMSCEVNGKELIDTDTLTMNDLNEWCKSTSSSQAIIIGLGLPSYAILQSLLYSIKAGATGLILSDGLEVTHLNGPRDGLFDWFFNPVIVLRDQIKAIEMEESELRFLEKFTLFGGNMQRVEAWANDSKVPQDVLRSAQIQAISRRLQGITRNISKFPTYRRRYGGVVKSLIAYSLQRKRLDSFQA